MRILRFILLAVGALGILMSLPLLGFAVLGYLGVLADVGPADNQKMGFQLLSLGAPLLISGLVLCLLGLFAFARNHRRADTDPGPRYNGGA